MFHLSDLACVSLRLSDAWFDSVRLWLLVATVALRLALMPRHLQAYLNMSRDKLDRIRQEAGRIRSTELQKKVGRGWGWDRRNMD